MHMKEIVFILDHFMDLLLKLLFFIFYAFSSIKSSQSNFSSTTFECSQGSIDLQYPFTSNTHDSPEFHLLCKNNLPAIKFPSYSELGIKSVSYSLKKMDLFDPRNCVHEVFLNLNLSHSHFKYYYVVKNYTYLNCSSRLPSPSFEQIPCLSGVHHHVYTVENNTTAVLDSSCRILKNVAIPFSYSPYLSDNSFGLGLTWDLPELQEKEQMAVRSKFWHMIASLCILTLAMAATMAIILLSRKRKRESEDGGSEDIRKLLQASAMGR